MTDGARWSSCVLAVVLLAWPTAAHAQTTDPDDWRIAVYPVLGWVPIGIAIDVNVPPISGGGGSGPDFGGKIVDRRFDGAFFGGISAAKGQWRIDADGLWAAVGGDRPERPSLRVDVDAVYAHALAGRKIYSDLYATVGVRRMSVKYEIDLAGREFSREPGLWDPLVGIAWHREAGTKLDLHATFEGGGFGVGADTDISASFRFDWKLTDLFGVTGGYSLLHFKLTHTVGDRSFIAKNTLHGPILGIGFYF